MPARGQDLNWIDLTDFTPGIQSGWHTGGGAESGKDGTAQIDGTYACVASPNGGLEGAPQIQTERFLVLDESAPLSEAWRDDGVPGSGYPSTVRIHDMKVQPMWHGEMVGGNYSDGSGVLPSRNPDAVMLAVEFFTNGNIGPAGADAAGRMHSWWLDNQMANVGSLLARSNGGTPLYTDQVSSQFMWANIAMVYSSYGTAPNPEVPGTPFAAWMWAAQAVGSGPSIPDAAVKTVVHYFPDPTSNTQPNSSTHLEAALTGWDWATYYKMVSHNDRLVFTTLLVPSSGYAAHYTQWGLGETKTDDTLFFHGINNVQDVTPTNLVQLTSEIIDGVGAVISGPANQLFVIRNHDGGLIISGSLESPQIDRFPGVEPVGGYVNHPVVTPVGIVYGTSGGVFAWPGGDHSVELSKGLEGTFWLTEMQLRPGDPVVSQHGRARRQPHTPCGTFAYRHPFIYCPNNYIYDTRTGGWFRLCEPEVPVELGEVATSGATLAHFCVGYNGTVYGAPAEVRRNLEGTGIDDRWADVAYFVFDPTKASSDWQWTSQPLVRGRNRILKVREVDVVTSATAGSPTMSITVTGTNGATQTRTLTLSGATQMQRVLFDVDCSDVTISFHAHGANVRLHRASLGFREFTSTNAT